MAQDIRRSQSNVPQSTSSGTASGTPARRHGGYSLFSSSPEEFFRMSPFQLMRHFSDEMDRMWSGRGQDRERRGEDLSSWRPMVDVREHNGQIQIHADLPGVNENDVKVAIENDMLVIRGERKREEEREEEGWYRAERSYGSFYRAIPIPEGAEADKANARFHNGVLEISMPISKTEQRVRQIPISGSGQSSTQRTSTQTSGQTNPQGTTTQTTLEKTGRAGGSA